MRHDEKDIIEHLRHNLERYPYGDGFTVLRELLQNADDAEATAVDLILLEGWQAAENPLLRGPGLLLVNDGRFDAQSAKGMQTFGGSVKAQDQNAIGRFGLGQKSVFHLCDAFVVVPHGYEGKNSPFVENPFDVLGQQGDACLEWNSISSCDATLIISASAQAPFGDRSLSFWFPLRRPGLRPKPRSNGIHGSDIPPENLQTLAHDWRLAEVLASLRHVRRISIEISGVRATLDRGESASMVGYAMEPGERNFGGPLGAGIVSLGRERREPDDYRQDLRESESWPRSRNRETDEEEPQKATPHGAAILLIDPKGHAEFAADWSVLLPVCEAIPARSNSGQDRIKLLLHGCFFVDSGRKMIAGLDGAAMEPSSEAQLRAEWNRALRDELVLPLVPSVLHDALEKAVLSGEALAAVVTALAKSDFGMKHRAAIASQRSLARVIEANREKASAYWLLVPANAELRPLPGPDARGRVAFADLLPDIGAWSQSRGLTLISGPEAILSAAPPKWEPDELAALLSSMEAIVFTGEIRTRALASFLAVAVTDDDLREAATTAVLTCLRKAIASDHPRLPHEAIRQTLSEIDCSSVIALPKTASERFLLRSLATAPGGPICLPKAWLPDATAQRNQLPAEQAFPLVAALQPLLKREAQAEAAGAAALTILDHLRNLDDALAHAELRELPVARVLDGQGTRLLSLGELESAARHEQLFRDTPEARKRLRLLSRALNSNTAFILPSALARAFEDTKNADRILGPTATTELNTEAACSIVRRSQTFGASSARADLINEIFTDKPDYREALRALAAGDPRAIEQRMRLVALRETSSVIDALVEKLLIGAAHEVVVPSAIMDRLDRGKARHLLIMMLEGEELGELLIRHADELKTLGLSSEIAEAIIRLDIPDVYLRALPILPTVGGGWAKPEQVHRENKDWALPSRMAALVPMLAPLGSPEARKRAEDLIHLWSPDAQISLCLDQVEPSLYALEILDALPCAKCADPERLRSIPWLHDRDGRPWKPEDVLDLSDEILAAARKTFGNDLLFLPASDLIAEIRDHPGFCTLRSSGILPDTEGSLEGLLLMVEEAALVGYMGEASEDLADALAVLARGGSELSLPGWTLIKAVLSGGTDPSRIITAFGAVKKGSSEHAGNWLSSLAQIAANHACKACDNTEIAKAARRVFANGFRQICSWDKSLISQVLTDVLVPVADGGWRPAQETVARIGGIGPSHRLAEDLETFWPQPDTDRTSEVIHENNMRGIGAAKGAIANPTSQAALEKVCAVSLEPVIERISLDLPVEAIALLVGVVRRTEVYKGLCRSHGVTEGALERISKGLTELESETFKPQHPGHSLLNIRQKTFLQFELTRPRTVNVVTLTGELRALPTDALEPLTVIGDEHRMRRPFEFDDVHQTWLRRVIVSDVKAPIEARHFEGLLKTVAKECLGFQDPCIEALKPLIDECLKIEQLTVDDARARLEDRLPQILAELKPERGTEPKRLINEYETKEQSLAPLARPKKLPDAKRKLWNGLLAPQASSQMLELIRNGIERYGYEPSRVIFELFQNADDASRQNSPPFAPEVKIEFTDDVIRALHWGRLINDLGKDPVEGERNRWQQDLFNMLVFNLSEKREDVTGRFGLGFKSVHLFAREVRIASRFVSCRVVGGMLPEVWEGGKQLSVDATREGRRATIIELDVDPNFQEEAKAARETFRRCARWIVATARAIRGLEIDGKRFAACFSKTSATAIHHVAFEGVETGHALALDLDTNSTFFLPLGPDGPESLPEGLPRLWLLAPLEEECGAGWLLNSYVFRVDPGRGRLAGTAEDRAAVFRSLGSKLGKRLLELYDLAERDWADFAVVTGLADRSPETGRVLFLQRLVQIFADDVPRDAQDQRLETHLHRAGGLYQLISERPALPTGLPLPFTSLLCATTARWRISRILAEPGRLERLKGWRAIERIGQVTLSPKSASLLERLGFKAPQRFGVGQLIRAELGNDRHVDPETAARLGAFFDEAFLESLSGDEQQELLNAAAEAQFQMANGNWRKARLSPHGAPKSSDEEQRILAFAPASVTADAAYRDLPEAMAFYRLAARRSGFQRNADAFAHWAQNLDDLAARRALLAYVIEGGLGDRLGELLASDRPHWLPGSADELRKSELLDGLDDESRGRLMTILYPELARSIATGRWPSSSPDIYESDETLPDPTGELERILAWWRESHLQERRAYDNRVHPSGFRLSALGEGEAGEDRLNWFTFFALGIFRTLPFNNEVAHKNFVEGAMQAGWWQDMAAAQLPADSDPWLRRLEYFASSDAPSIDSPQWQRALCDLYALARWLPDYADAFQLLPRVVEKEGQISLIDLWSPSYSPVWQRRGLKGAPLTQSLGLGANWMIREAIRHEFWPEDDAVLMHPYAWSATGRLRRLFDEQLDFPLGDRGSMDQSPIIHDFVESHLGADATFLGDLDLPLQIWSGR